ncbi:RluA family pseudouridine synthase, partial [Desulfovibrio sp. OttesenSCG-928-O18]|nr:RluA family pseudouridine synthase [Desulfovibrio sp. OttesenSCG-928-O18]
RCLWAVPVVSNEIMDKKVFTVSENDAGSRLDAFLARALSCGVRGAKRLIEGGFVLVNNKTRPAQYKLTADAMVAVATVNTPASSLAESVRLVAANDEYATFFKPAGLHTVHVSGGDGESLERILAQKWPEISASLPNAPFPRLLTRLDKPTSGLVAAAFSAAAGERFRRFETEGQVNKRYLAVVRGELDAPFTVENELDTDNRKKTRVRETFCADFSRHTGVTPLRPLTLPAAGEIAATLVEARIKRGARHQIRAHLAHAGFPILGDTLYGSPEDTLPLFLHHGDLALPGFSAVCPPSWFPI